MMRAPRPPFWWGLVLGFAAAVLALEVPYINWHTAAPPVDAQPLVIRKDAKGDGRFGAPRSGRRIHRGVDLAAPLGSPVRAIRSGTVIQIGTHRGFGRFVELDHRNDLTSFYAHLDAVNVTMGQRLTQGQVLGTVGKTGNARHPWITPHVHLEVAKAGHVVDPSTMGLRAVAASSARATSSSDDDRGGE